MPVSTKFVSRCLTGLLVGHRDVRGVKAGRLRQESGTIARNCDISVEMRIQHACTLRMYGSLLVSPSAPFRGLRCWG